MAVLQRSASRAVPESQNCWDVRPRGFEAAEEKTQRTQDSVDATGRFQNKIKPFKIKTSLSK